MLYISSTKSYRQNLLYTRPEGMKVVQVWTGKIWFAKFNGQLQTALRKKWRGSELGIWH